MRQDEGLHLHIPLDELDVKVIRNKGKDGGRFVEAKKGKGELKGVKVNC